MIKKKRLRIALGLFLVAILAVVLVTTMSQGQSRKNIAGGPNNFTADAAFCSSPLSTGKSVSPSGKLMVEGFFKKGVSANQISAFEFESMGESLAHCITYFSNPASRSHIVDVFGTSREIKKFQSYIIFYLNSTHKFRSVTSIEN
jgi:hypothetical protein